MISFNEAYRIVVSSQCTLKKKNVHFLNASGKILAEDVISDVDMPPFNKTAVDGYACRMVDIQNELHVIEIIPAGKTPEKKISQGECSKIMTGASVPEGADCVLMVENTTELPDGSIKFTLSETAKNICNRGEDVKKGDVVLKSGTKLEPQHIAVLASVGCVNLVVFASPQVAVISTGNELVEPGVVPIGAQIRNSNAFQLISQIKQIGAVANYSGIAEDNEQATFDIIKKAMQENDLIIITGGVSMGDYDYVPKVLTQMGFEHLFHSIAVQPGRPTVFSKNENKFCFGLPGNPVSSFIQFELLVKPLIYKMMGYDFHPLKLRMPLTIDYSRKKADRLAIIPVVINQNNSVTPSDYHGSAHIHALTKANGLMFVPVDVLQIKKGEFADVRQI